MGIAQEAEIDAEMTMFNDSALSGLTGIWCTLPKRPVDLIFGDDLDRICFRAHSLSQMQSLNNNDLHPKSLLYLFLGLLPSKSGKLYDLKVPKVALGGKKAGRFQSHHHSTQRRRRKASTSDSEDEEPLKLVWKIVGPNQDEVSLWRERIAFDVQLKLPGLYKIEEQRSAELPEPEPSRGWATEGPYCFVERDSSPDLGAWMHKTEVCAIVLSFLNLKSSPRGYLLGPAMKHDDEDALLNKVFPQNRLRLLLGLGKEVLPYSTLTDEKKTSMLAKVTEAINQDLKTDRIMWSRGTMKTFSELDVELSQLFDVESIEMQTLALLFIVCSDFRSLVFKSKEHVTEAVTCNTTLDFTTNRVIVVYPPQDSQANPWGIPFDFATYMEEAPRPVAENQPNIDMLYPQVIFCCLFAELRIAMWNIMLSGVDLQNAYTSLGRTVHIAASTMPPERDFWALLQDGTSLIKRGDSVMRMAMSKFQSQIEVTEKEMSEAKRRDEMAKIAAKEGRLRKASSRSGSDADSLYSIASSSRTGARTVPSRRPRDFGRRRRSRSSSEYAAIVEERSRGIRSIRPPGLPLPPHAYRAPIPPNATGKILTMPMLRGTGRKVKSFKSKVTFKKPGDP
ncbi:hypothetical protein BT63DRAFT_59985 [Microthyrium microscopicum]|uniref:Uncharacterized protein n=1 Tax=Microthyrium microscopicum TaxID=703497 RepID=A0A6A6TZK9_9PEZI|nr:hypothetical protein BT63DRAFT_59985 [Microthyrium microscopicum]